MKKREAGSLTPDARRLMPDARRPTPNTENIDHKNHVFNYWNNIILSSQAFF